MSRPGRSAAPGDPSSSDGEFWRAKGYELVMRYGSAVQQLEAKQRRAELNSWPGRRPGLVRAKQGRAS